MKKILSLILMMLMLVSLAACGSDTGADSNAEGKADTRIVVDHDGVEVELPLEVERIVVCDILPLPSVLSVFFDSADKIVGMSSTSMSAAANGLLGELYPDILDAETGFIDGSTVSVEELEVICWEDLGCEAIKELQIQDFPLFVAEDCHGGSIFAK